MIPPWSGIDAQLDRLCLDISLVAIAAASAAVAVITYL